MLETASSSKSINQGMFIWQAFVLAHLDEKCSYKKKSCRSMTIQASPLYLHTDYKKETKCEPIRSFEVQSEKD